MFLDSLVKMGGFTLNHHWHGINVLMVLECVLLLTLLASAIAVFARIAKSKRLTLWATIASLTFATAAYAVNTTLSGLAASGAIASGNLFYVVQTGGAGGVKATAAQIATFINSLFSGDATVASGGAVTLATVNANVGTFGSATACITTTQNAKGLTTAMSATTCTPALASITGLGTGVPAALAIAIGNAGAPVLFNGAGGTPSSLTLTNATGLPLGSITGFGANCATFLATPTTANFAACVTGETGTGAVMFGTLPDITTGFTIGGAATAGNYVRGDGAKFVSSAIQAADLPVLTVTQRTESGANPALPSSDQTKLIYLSNGSNQVPTIAQAGTAGFINGWFATYCNIGAGTQTITPATSTIGGQANLLIPAGSAARPHCYTILSDGTNYTLSPQSGTVFTGTLALATSAIGSAACSSAQTVTAPGVATTDVPLLSFNADPTAVTGYVPLTAGMLTIIGYPTANTVNVKVCNNTSSSITPGAITLNVKVMR